MRAFKPVNQFLPFAAKGLLADAPHGSLGHTATRTPWRWDLGFVAKINLRCPRCGGWACSQQGAEAALTVAEERLTEDIGKGVWKAGETTRGWSVRGLSGGSCYIPRTRESCGWKGCLWGGGGAGLQLTVGSSEEDTFLGPSLLPPQCPLVLPGSLRASSQDTLCMGQPPGRR